MVNFKTKAPTKAEVGEEALKILAELRSIREELNHNNHNLANSRQHREYLKTRRASLWVQAERLIDFGEKL